MNRVLPIIQIIVSSGLIVAIYNNYTEIRTQNKLRLLEINENRYRSMLIFMDIILNPSHFVHSTEWNPTIADKINDDELILFYKNKVETYLSNMYLYAEINLIDEIKDFINNPDEEKYISVANKMKASLWE